MKVAIYARYSSENQRDASIADQFRVCREFAQRQGWQVAAEYSDHAVSGATIMRPGFQAMMREALQKKVDIVMAEALDRFSRDQEDTAGLFKRLTFAGVNIVTLAEGDFTHLHIGLKGTMNALFVKELAEKTRRGLRGRIELGKAGGGVSFGYRIVRRLENGVVTTGEREIVPDEAAIIRRIFNDYRAGASPKQIAKALNSERVRGPRGALWSPSPIHGNPERGIGLLHNELYIGRLVWNRQRFLKDPDTGKRTDGERSVLHPRARRWEPQRRMDDREGRRLTDRGLHALFDRLFPHGFAGADVLAEIATEGWACSPLLACFHPSVEQLFEERVAIHRNLERWRQLGRRREGAAALEPRPEPTLEDVRREYEASPVNVEEEVTELVGLCLWDVFSDNHDVIAADGRFADIGSFRGAGAFLDEYLTRDQEGWRDGDYMRFYMGTIWISRRADLTPVYAMIFRRLTMVGADRVYRFPEIGIVELAPADDTDKAGDRYSVSRAAVAEIEAQQRRVEVERLRAELREANARAREAAMDRPAPATVRAYQQIYGRDPRGWPPV